MKSKKEVRGSKAILVLFALSFIASLFNSGGFAYADTPTRCQVEKAFLATTNVNNADESDTTFDMKIQNASSSQGGTVFVYGQENVSSLQILINGTACGNAVTTGLWTTPFQCNSSVLTTAILSNTANISIKNSGSNPMKVSGTISACWLDNASGVDTSSLATSAQLNTNTTTILNNIANANTTIQNALSSNYTALKNETNYIYQNLTAVKNETNYIYQNVTAVKNETNAIYQNVTQLNNYVRDGSLASAIWSVATRTLTLIKQSIIQLA